MSEIHLRKYGVAATIPFRMFEVDGVDFRVDAVHASGDSKIMKDEAVEANTTNSFTDEGTGYSIVLTATEMQAARIVVYLVDQTATKVWLDTSFEIETYGNASAQHAFDLDTASVAQTADHTAGIADIPTVAELNARTLVAAGYFDPAADTVANVTTVATTTTNTDMVAEAPTAVQNRQEMDSNSVDLDAIQANQTTINNNVLAVPTAVENRQEMDANSTQLAAIVLDTGTTLPGLIVGLAVEKNVAFPNFEFLMVLASDNVTPATGLTVTGQRSINGGAFTGVAGTIAEVSNGIYQFDALAADTNGDVITWRFSAATANDTFVTVLTSN